MKKILFGGMFLTALFGSIFLIQSHAMAAGCTAVTTGSWSTGSNWTGCAGVGGVPASTDTVTINSGITVTLTAATTVAGATINNGKIDTSTSNFAFTTGTLDVETGGTFEAHSSTVTFTGTSGTIITNNSGDSAIHSIGTAVFNGNGTITLSGGSHTVSFNNLTFSPTLTANHSYTLGSGITHIGANFNSTPTASSAFGLTVNLSSAFTTPFGISLHPAGSATTLLDTVAGQNYALNASSISFYPGGTLNAEGSTVTLSGNDSPLALFGGTFTSGTSTVVMNADATMALSPTFYPPSFYNLTLTPTLTDNRTYTFGSSDPFTISNNLTINPTASSALALTVQLGAGMTVGGTVLIEGSGSATSILDTTTSNYALGAGTMTITTAGTLDGQNSLITVGGSWTNNGTFNAGTSTVTLNSAATAAVTGPTTFYNLSIIPNAAKEVDFSTASPDVIAVTNIFSARGTSGNLVKLHSTSSGTQWHFYPTGSATADWVDVEDSSCHAGSVNISAADYTNSGNNDSCWTSVNSVPFGTTYYVDPAGSDSNNGTTPSTAWQTLTKVNGFTFQPGDEILFKKGGTWTGELASSTAGSSAHPITFSSYGTGAKPIISGFSALSSWTSLGGGIYGATCTSCGSSVNIVTVNGIEQGIGRYPNADAANSGYLTFQTHSGTTAITSSALTGSPNWTGAQVVIRDQRWKLDKYSITSQSGGTLTHSDGGVTPADGFGFFIQNDPRTLDETGEWYYDSGSQQLQMYFGASDPNASVVNVSTVPTLLSLTKNYIVVDGLSFQGSGTSSISVESAANATVQNTDINFSGTDGIDVDNANNFTVQNSTINHSNDMGITFAYNGSSSHGTIKNNVIQNTGLFAAVMGVNNLAFDGAISIDDTNANDPNDYVDIEQNEIDNTGYNGITFTGEGAVVNNNFINGFDLVKDDGGGIYTGDGASRAYAVTRQVTNNIILNGAADYNGTNDTSGDATSNGIYMDDDTYNVAISGNTAANNAQMGIFLHNPVSIQVTNNMLYNNTREQFGIQPNNSATTIRNNVITGNTFIAPTNTEYMADIIPANNGDTMTQYGTMDNNYYVHPSDLTNLFSTTFSSPTDSLAQWQAAFSVDANSHEVIIPSGVTPQFFYNSTSSSSTRSLSGNFNDAQGNTYANSITLAPYSSAVLMQIVTATPAPSSSSTIGTVSGGGGPTWTPSSATTSADTSACQPGDNFNALTGAACPANSSSVSTSIASSSSLSFTKNLILGMTDPQVKMLQQYLNTHDFIVAKSGAGSIGKETSYFGPATKAALSKFQKAHGISPTNGYFGPITRAYINKNQ